MACLGSLRFAPGVGRSRTLTRLKVLPRVYFLRLMNVTNGTFASVFRHLLWSLVTSFPGNGSAQLACLWSLAGSLAPSVPQRDCNLALEISARQSAQTHCLGRLAISTPPLPTLRTSLRLRLRTMGQSCVHSTTTLRQLATNVSLGWRVPRSGSKSSAPILSVPPEFVIGLQVIMN